MTGIYQVSNYTPCQIGLVKGERGENGANGANGLNGKDGKDGKDGLRGLSGSDGKSNYQLALDSGFIGSLDDYLLSMKCDTTELSNKVSALESDLSTANTEIDKVKLDTGITATSKFGGVERTQADKNTDVITINDIYDAATTDYTEIFNSIATVKKGAVLDLGNKILPASSIPDDIQLINGAIETDGKIVPMSLTARAHPLDGNMGVILDDGTSHFWCHEIIYDPTDGKTHMFVKSAYAHGLSISTPLSMYTSEDGGLSVKSTKAVYSRVGYDIAEVRGGIMNGGRYGLFLTMRTAESVYTNDFVFSDDKGKTWTAIEDVCAGHFSYSDMMQHPTNANTFYVYGYLGNNLQVAKTTNNGATWTNTTVSVGIVVSEPSVVKIPGQNKWIMFIRTQNNMYISTSTNMENWSAGVNTGVDLGANPVQAVIEHGKLYIYLFIRDLSERLSSQNTALLMVEDYDYVFDNKKLKNPTNLLPIFTGIDRSLGYMRIKPMRTGNIFTLNAGEFDGDTKGSPLTSGGTSSKVVIGSTQMSGVPLLARSRPNHFRNPRFDFWSRGDTFTTSTNGKTADGWWTNNSGATITTTKVDVPYDISQSLPFKPKYGMKIVATADDYVGIFQEDYSPTAITSSQNQIITVQIWGIGKIPTLELAYAQVFGTGGSERYSNAGFSLDVGTTGDNKVWHGTGRIAIKGTEGLIIGEGSNLKLTIQSRIIEEWDCTILGVHAVKSSQLTPFTVAEYNESLERARCEEYLQSFEYLPDDNIGVGFAATDISFQAVVPYSKKIRKPTVTVVGSLQQYPRNMELVVTSVTEISQTNATIRASSDISLIPGAAGVMRAGDEAVKVIIDAE